jgi:uncharacterized sulfatase
MRPHHLLIPTLALFLGAYHAHAASDRTNVLFIISDDLTSTVLGCYGHPTVQTPNIDRLASRGLLFERAYCQMPYCGPSRASLLTGMLVDETTVYNNKDHFRKTHPDITTLPEAFRDAGYFTARVGKVFHYGVPGDIGTSGLDDPQSWDEVVNPIGRDKTEEDKIFSLIPGQFGGTLSWLAAEGTDEQQTDGIGAIEAIKLLEAHQDEAFFLAVGFYRPHTPFVAPKQYFDLYDVDAIPVPPEQQPREPAAAWGKVKPANDKMTDTQRREAIRAYYASVTFLDAQVGRVIDALDRLGLADNTVIVLTSDHGYHLGEHGLWQKRSLFEESAAVPLIIAAPGMTDPGRRTTQLAELVDCYPTLADLCGLPKPDHTSGVSLAPLLKDPAAPTKPAALTMETRRAKGKNFKGYTIRTDRYRYTEWDGGEEGYELYDHETDPREMTNLAGRADHADTQARLKDTLHKRLANQRSN